MNKHVTSLELSQRLAKAGVKQKSIFFYAKNNDNHFQLYPLCVDPKESKLVESNSKNEEYSTFLATDILEMLPDQMCDENEDIPYYLTFEKRSDPDYWIVFYHDKDRGMLGELNGKLHIEAPTLQDCAGEMLLTLIEKGLITIE